MTSLHSLPSVRERGLVIHKQVRQVDIMAIILFIYSSILALGVWQENQNLSQAETEAATRGRNKLQRRGC